MLDPALTLRLEVFAATDGVAPAIVPFVQRELEQLPLAPDRLTDEKLGTFTSHLVNALARTERGEGLTEFEAQDVIDAVIAEKPESLTRATELAGRAHETLGIELPDTEIRILTLHLATM